MWRVLILLLLCQSAVASDFKIDFNNLVTGKQERVPVTLHQPKTPLPSKPAVIYMSGCDGSVSDGGRKVIKGLVERGILVAELESLSMWGRWANVCKAERGSLTGAQRAEEAYRVRDELVKRGLTEEANVGLVGFSHGGWAITHAIYLDGTPNYNTEKTTPFAAAVAFYPWCQTTDSPTFNLRTPTLLMGGGKDEWTPWQRCTRMERITKESSTTYNKSLELVLYEEASHSWDNQKPHRLVPTHRAEGAYLWHDPNATADSVRRTFEFFEKNLKLN